MAVLKGQDADDEILKVQAINGLTAAPTEFPFTGLSPDDFERLNYALFKKSAPDNVNRDWSDVAIMVRGADAGRDLLLLADHGSYGVVQCKRLESSISLPVLLREIIKLILYPDVDKSLPQIGEGTHYFLSLATEAAKTVVDFFVDPYRSLRERDQSMPSYVEEVRESYTTLGVLDAANATAKVRRILPTLKYGIVRPVDLNGWLARESNVATRFFKHRILVDDASVVAAFAQMKNWMDSIGGRLGGLPLLTDVDLRLIKDRTESVPESHRTSFGFASLFGFPREMFVGERNLHTRGERINKLVREVGQDFLDWLHEQVDRQAVDICDRPEVMFTVHPCARLAIAPFLSSVVSENIEKNVVGKVMTRIIAPASGRLSFGSDDDRLQHVKETLLASGKRYLRDDFSAMVGEGELLEQKKELARASVRGLKSAADLEIALDLGIGVLRRHLDLAAQEIRRLSAYPLSIFLTDSSSIDDPAVVRRIADTVAALEGLRPATSGTKA